MSEGQKCSPGDGCAGFNCTFTCFVVVVVVDDDGDDDDDDDDDDNDDDVLFVCFSCGIWEAEFRSSRSGRQLNDEP